MTAMPPSVQLRPLQELLDGFAGAVPEVAVRDLALDSRQVVPGALFLAVRGTRGHGLAHLPEALARGAAAVAWEPAEGVSAPAVTQPCVAVPGLARHAGEIAARFFGHPTRDLHCVGITGTDGKTSTAFLLAQALEALGRACLYLGTLGAGRYGDIEPGDLTTPDPVNLQRRLRAAVRDGCAAVAMEVSSHALDQARVGGLRFHTAVLTNVGRDHLDYHGTLERYAAAKRRLFDLPGLHSAVLNRDDPLGARWADELAGAPSLVRYGLDGPPPAGGRFVTGRGLRLSAQGVAFTVDSHAGTARIDSRLLGRFNAYNLMAALAALLEAGAALPEAAQALSRAATVPGRIEGFRGPRAAPLVVVDYAHTPQALAQVLEAVRAHAGGAVTVVFGCGGDRDAGKRPQMGAAAVQRADRVIVTDDNPRTENPGAIVRGILGGIPGELAEARQLRVIHDRAEAIRVAVAEATTSDVVVVAGKGHEDYQIYGTERRSFSDRAFVSQLVGAGESRQ